MGVKLDARCVRCFRHSGRDRADFGRRSHGIGCDWLELVVRIDTTASEAAGTYPSSPGQLELGRLLVEELRAMGVADAAADDKGIVMATLIESPSLVLRDRWFRSRAQERIAAAESRAEESIFARQNMPSGRELAKPVDSAMV